MVDAVKQKGSNWVERARNGHQKMAQFFSQYGSKTGLGGATLLLMGGSAAMMASAMSNNPGSAAVAGTAAGSLVLAGVLKAGGFSAAEHVARKHLKDIGGVFDGEQRSAKPTGATPVDDPVLADPAFQKAMASAFHQLEGDPEARRGFNEMIQNSPSARRALMNAQKQLDAANEMREQQATQAQSAPAATEGDEASMTLH